MANVKRIVKAATDVVDTAKTAGKAAGNTAQAAGSPFEQFFGENYPKPATREAFLNAYADDVAGMTELYTAAESGSPELQKAMGEAAQAGPSHTNGVAGAIADALYPAAPKATAAEKAGLTAEGTQELLKFFSKKAPGTKPEAPKPEVAAKVPAEKVAPAKAPRASRIKGKIEDAQEVPANNVDNAVVDPVESTTKLAPTPAPTPKKAKKSAAKRSVAKPLITEETLLASTDVTAPDATGRTPQEAANDAMFNAPAEDAVEDAVDGAVDGDPDLTDLDLAAQTIENIGNGPQVDPNAPDFSNVAQSQTGEPDLSNINLNPMDTEKLSQFLREAAGQPDPADMQAAARQRGMSQDYQPEQVVDSQPSPIGGLIDEQGGVDTSVVTPPKTLIGKLKTASKYGAGAGLVIGAEEILRQNLMGGGENNGSTGGQNPQLEQALQDYLLKKYSQQRMPQEMPQQMPQGMQQGMPQ